MPSSPSTTLGCLTSCENHCSSRLPPPMCLRSSVGRRSISSLSSKPLPKVRYGFVDPIGLLSSASMARCCVVLLLIMHRQNLKRSFDKIQFVPAAAVALVVPHSNDEPFIFAT